MSRKESLRISQMKIRVRDDDVLVGSATYKNVFARFCRIHEIIVNNGGIHVPAILCNSIMEFPECIEFIRHEAMEGRMIPELHGWDHIDYGTLSRNELNVNLAKCTQWFEDYLWVKPSIFYTPWGANSALIKKVAQNHALTVIDCSNITKPFQIVDNYERYRLNAEVLGQPELTIHWWEKSDRRNLELALKILGDREDPFVKGIDDEG